MPQPARGGTVARHAPDVAQLVTDLRAAGDRPEEVLRGIETLRGIGEAERALEVLAPVYDRYFNQERFAAALAELLIETGRLGEAVPLLQGLRKQAPRSAEYQAIEAELLLRQGRFDTALDAARAAVRLAPQSPRACRALARAAAVQKLQDEYRTAFDRAVALSPGDGGILRDYGEALGRFGLAAEAVDRLRQAVALRPTDPAALGLLASQLARTSDRPNGVEEAIRLLRRAAELAPGATEPRYRLGKLLLDTGDPAGAVGPLEKCLVLDPTFEEAWLPLGQAHQAAGNVVEARRAFAAYRLYSDYRRQSAQWNLRLRRSPNSVTLLERMARLQDEHGRKPAALRYYRRLQAVQPSPGTARRIRTLEQELSANQDPGNAAPE